MPIYNTSFPQILFPSELKKLLIMRKAYIIGSNNLRIKPCINLFQNFKILF